MLDFVAIALIACDGGRPPPPPSLACEDDPTCGRNGRATVAVPTTPEEQQYLSRCAEPESGDDVASASLGYFGNAIDPTSTTPFDSDAQIYARSATLNSFACTEAQGNRQFQLMGATGDPGPMRVQPGGSAAGFEATLLNRVDFQELPLTVPVFPVWVVAPVFDDLGIERDPDKGTIVIEVFEPPGFFDLSAADAGADVPTRPRHSGSTFTSDDAEAVAYRVDGEWTTDASATGDEGLAVIVNVPGQVGLGSQSVVVQREGDEGTSLDRYLWAAEGAITFAAMPPAL